MDDSRIQAAAALTVSAIEEMVRRIAREEVRLGTENRRPGGVDSWDFNVSLAGTANVGGTTVSGSVPAGLARIPYPGIIDGAELAIYPAGTLEVDFRICPPGVALTAGTNCTGGTTLVLSGLTIGSVPAASGWVRKVVPGSWAYALMTVNGGAAGSTDYLACAALIVRPIPT